MPQYECLYRFASNEFKGAASAQVLGWSGRQPLRTVHMHNLAQLPFDLASWRERMRRDPLALLIDLDGTLIPFADSPDQADLDSGAVRLLDTLAFTGIRVVIVSGRPQPSLDRVATHSPRTWWVAEHSLWRRSDGDWIGPTAPAAELDSLAGALGIATVIPGVWLERKSQSLCIHWRQVAASHREVAIAGAEFVCDEWLESHPEFERLDGVEALEIRHRSASKAAAVRWIRDTVPGASVIAIGDDQTDEDMFAALHQDELAIAVRNDRQRHSCANAWVPGWLAVREFLWWLVEVRSRDSQRPPPIELTQPQPQPALAERPGLVVVSNRSPTHVAASRQRPVGGLVSALEPALRTYQGIWLGWSGYERDAAPTLKIDDGVRPVRASFDFPPRWRKHFYTGFCNRALWPLLHGFSSRARYSDTDWHAYVEANDAYARFAAQLVAPDGTVWIHDYHLLLVGEALRRHGHRGSLGLFLHVPFPQRDLFETLPWCDQLLAGLRAFDLVGFHTEQWAENCRACLAAHDARSAAVHPMPEIAVLPIGVDPTNFTTAENAIDEEVSRLKASLGSRRMILGVDRLDFSKGIPERLAAFEHLLEHHPAWRRQLSFVQISVPSRADVPEYAELRHRVENLVGKINGRFGEADWVPVRYLYRSYDHRVLAQLYRAADVGLVTPLRDGLNLVAKEFVIAQDPEQPGVLVLSRFAGSAVELTDAVLTNPYHPDGLAADIDRALRMPLDERRRRHASLAATVGRITPQTWAAAFLERLASTQARSARVAGAR